MHVLSGRSVLCCEASIRLEQRQQMRAHFSHCLNSPLSRKHYKGRVLHASCLGEVQMNTAFPLGGKESYVIT